MSEPRTPADIVRFPREFPNLKNAIKADSPVRIIAVGSSSTAGREDILPYPSWLQWALRRAHEHKTIDVINRGVGGEDAPEELERLKQAAAEKPAMIIWQVGTNAIFHADRYVGGQVAAAIENGLDAICTPEIDVLVMDLQYAPALLRPEKKTATQALAKQIAEIVAARPDRSLQLFPRFALMQHWHEIDGISFDRMTDPTDGDRLHQSEWSTRAVAQALCDALGDAVK
ncbi:MAG: hypothetical protein JWR77_2532 [Rhizorhabdus sp.]|nr:hypothetical protein [Rhizorhabdus sp.]